MFQSRKAKGMKMAESTPDTEPMDAVKTGKTIVMPKQRNTASDKKVSFRKSVHKGIEGLSTASWLWPDVDSLGAPVNASPSVASSVVALAADLRASAFDFLRSM